MHTTEATLKSMVPSSLDDVIRKNRDKVCAYVSTDEELRVLRGPVPIRRAKGEISNWNFVSFHFVEKQDTCVYLVGFNAAESSSWMTSMVMAVGDGVVATASGSLYLLAGEKGSNDDLDLPFICATLNAWGLGPHLGIPAFFF